MRADLPLPLLALLHEGGWDEVLIVAVGLIVAYGIIMWTGRRSRGDDADDEELDGGALDDATVLPADRSRATEEDPPRSAP